MIHIFFCHTNVTNASVTLCLSDSAIYSDTTYVCIISAAPQICRVKSDKEEGEKYVTSIQNVRDQRRVNRTPQMNAYS